MFKFLIQKAQILFFIIQLSQTREAAKHIPPFLLECIWNVIIFKRNEAWVFKTIYKGTNSRGVKTDARSHFVHNTLLDTLRQRLYQLGQWALYRKGEGKPAISSVPTIGGDWGKCRSVKSFHHLSSFYWRAKQLTGSAKPPRGHHSLLGILDL